MTTMEEEIKMVSCTLRLGISYINEFSLTGERTRYKIAKIKEVRSVLLGKKESISGLVRKHVSAQYLPNSGSNDISISVIAGTKPGEIRIETRIGYEFFKLLLRNAEVPPSATYGDEEREQWFVEANNEKTVLDIFDDIEICLNKIQKRQEEQLEFLLSEAGDDNQK